MSDAATTKAFQLKSVPKMDNFKARFAPPTVDSGTSAPKVSVTDNFLSRLNIDNRNAISEGVNHTIDFQGNMLPIFMAISFYVSTFYDELDLKNASKLSPPSLAAVLLNMIYAFYLVSDLKLRSSPSKYTNFLSTPEYIDYQAFLLSMPIPDIMIKFMLAAAPTSDPRRPNIAYTPSFNSFSYEHDFGRYLPSRIFILAHNFVLKHKTNDVADTLMNKLMQTTFAEINNQKLSLAHLFGQQLDVSGTSSSYNNQLFQSFEAIVNPALARTRSAKNVYSRIFDEEYYASTTATASTPDMNIFNPYQYLIGLDQDNVSEHRTFMESIISQIGTKLGNTTPLGNVISSLAGTNILIHGYLDHAIPTWHCAKTLRASDAPKQLKPAKYAEAIGFLVDAPAIRPDTLAYDSDSLKKLEKRVYLVEADDKSPFPIKDNLDIASALAARPPIRVLDPYDYNPTSFKTVFLNGALIESRAIDGSAVPLPHAKITLDDENSLFLQSAIPLSSIYRAIRFGHDGQTKFWSEPRSVSDESQQKAATMLYDLSSNRLPNYNQTYDTDNLNSYFPGFEILSHVSRLFSAYNRFGFWTPTERDQERTTPVNLPANSVLVWSPYRYDAGNLATKREDRIFMITNLRTIFGTNPPLGEIPHFLDAIPIA